MNHIPESTYQLTLVHHDGREVALETTDPTEAVVAFAKESVSQTPRAELCHITILIDGHGPYHTYCDLGDPERHAALLTWHDHADLQGGRLPLDVLQAAAREETPAIALLTPRTYNGADLSDDDPDHRTFLNGPPGSYAFRPII